VRECFELLTRRREDENTTGTGAKKFKDSKSKSQSRKWSRWLNWRWGASET